MENEMFVARFTKNPEYDAAHPVAFWMGPGWESESEALKAALEPVCYECVHFSCDHAYHTDCDCEERDCEHYLEHLRSLADRHNVAVGFYEPVAKWQIFHHDGLACFDLESETLKDAIAEAALRFKNGPASWFGRVTEGKVRHVCAVQDVEDLHIFECESTAPEP